MELGMFQLLRQDGECIQTLMGFEGLSKQWYRLLWKMVPFDLLRNCCLSKSFFQAKQQFSHMITKKIERLCDEKWKVQLTEATEKPKNTLGTVVFHLHYKP